MTKRFVSFPVIALVALLVLAACGAGDEGSAGKAGQDVATRISKVPGAPTFVPFTPGSPVAGGTPSPAAAQQPAASPAAGGGAATAGGGPITIEAYDIGWKFNGEQTAPGKPITVTVAPGAKISLPNTGASPHNFSVDKLGIKVDMPAGQTVETAIPADAAPGDYEFYCDVPGHMDAGMVGTLKVRAGGAPAPAAPAGGTAPAGAAAPAGGGAAAQTVTAVDIAFQPKELTIPAGSDVPITLTNTGAAPHNFAIDALKISVDLAPGATEQTTINAPAGTYDYYCNVPGHKEAGMVGKLTVK